MVYWYIQPCTVTTVVRETRQSKWLARHPHKRHCSHCMFSPKQDKLLGYSPACVSYWTSFQIRIFYCIHHHHHRQTSTDTYMPVYPLPWSKCWLKRTAAHVVSCLKLHWLTGSTIIEPMCLTACTSPDWMPQHSGYCIDGSSQWTN